MADNRKMVEQNIEELEQATGGRFKRCRHKNKVRTGNQREVPFLHFWSKHQNEYHCPDCGATFWVYEG